jgi:hypothetical protein
VFGVAGALATIAGMALIHIVVFPAHGLSANEPAMNAVKSVLFWF